MLEGVSATTIAPRADASGLAPLDQALGGTTQAIAELNGQTISPSVNRAEVQGLIGDVRTLISLVGEANNGLSRGAAAASALISKTNQLQGALAQAVGTASDIPRATDTLYTHNT